MKHIKYSKEAVNLIVSRMPDEFHREFVRLWLGTDITTEKLADELHYSVRSVERYIAKINRMIEQMLDIVNGDVKRGGVSMVDGHIDEPRKTNYDRIRNMRIDELAEFLKLNSFDDAIWIDGHNWIHIDEIKQWLESEVTE